MAEIIIPEEDLEMGEENVENPDKPIIPEYTPNSDETELREELEELKTTVGTYSRDIESLFDRVGKILNSITISEDCRNLTDIQMVISNEIIRNADGNNVYIFTNNSNVWFTSDKTWDNLKGVNALLSMDGDYVRIYYINNVTFTSSISYNPSTQAYNFSQWTYRELPRFKELKSGEAIGSQNGKILTYDPSNGIGFSPFKDTDFLKNDVIKGVIEVVSGSMLGVVKEYVIPFFKKFYLLKLIGEELEQQEIEGSLTEDSITKTFQKYSITALEKKSENEYVFNPLSISTYTENASGPALRGGDSGIYIFINRSNYGIHPDELSNDYKNVYGFCSISGSDKLDNTHKQYIYYPNITTYHRGRTGNGYDWVKWNRIDIRNYLNHIAWYSYSNFNDYVSTGVYLCSNGVCYNSNSLPNLSVDDNFSFVLNVSTGDGIVGQTLMLTSKDNNETKIYTRIKNGERWYSWCEPGEPCDLGQISNSVLKDIKTPGLYKGIISEPTEKPDTLYQFVYNTYGYSGKEISQYYNIPHGSVFELGVMSNNVLSGNVSDKSLPAITQRLKLNLRSGHSLEIYRTANILEEERPINWWHKINEDVFGYTYLLPE